MTSEWEKFFMSMVDPSIYTIVMDIQDSSMKRLVSLRDLLSLMIMINGPLPRIANGFPRRMLR